MSGGPGRARPGVLLAAATVATVVALGPARPVAAQQRPAPAPDTLTQSAHTVSPGGAFARAMLVPGWGHVAIGSYTRAGFYFALETATAYTFLRTRSRLADVRQRSALRESFLRESLARNGVTDPTVIQNSVDSDPTLQDLRSLVSSRKGQREDILAWGIFTVLLAGADAFVSAHLAHFPAPIELDAAPADGGGAHVGLRLRMP